MARKALRPPVKEAVIDAAIDTLARNPGASLSEIAARAGVGRASLHRHFSSRGRSRHRHHSPVHGRDRRRDRRSDRSRPYRLRPPVEDAGGGRTARRSIPLPGLGSVRRREPQGASRGGPRMAGEPGRRAEGGRRDRARRAARLGGRQHRRTGLARLVADRGGEPGPGGCRRPCAFRTLLQGLGQR